MLDHLRILIGIFQQADYDRALFRAWLARHPTPKDWKTFEKKATPRWTLKARILFWIALAKSLGIPRLMPRILLFTPLILGPFEKIAIWTTIRRARKKLQNTAFKEIIGITGSYGKTTTKEAIAHVLGAKFRVHKTPENTNTILGIARWALSKSDFQNGDILIVEMGAYRRGDIAAICRMAWPTVGVLTGLNEAHLERFGLLENTFWTKGELVDALSKNSETTSPQLETPSPNDEGGILFWNHSSFLLKAFLEKHAARWRGVCFIPFDGDALIAAKTVAHNLGLSDAEIIQRLHMFQPVDRRFTKTFAPGNRLIVDDSYNITLDGARHAYKKLKETDRRKIGIFAGIPEAGKASERVNRELGRLIAETFDYILLRHTPVCDFILAGLKEKQFSEERIMPYNESDEVEPLLEKIAQDGDCIYFSAYDWPAIYL